MFYSVLLMYRKIKKWNPILYIQSISAPNIC